MCGSYVQRFRQQCVRKMQKQEQLLLQKHSWVAFIGMNGAHLHLLKLSKNQKFPNPAIYPSVSVCSLCLAHLLATFCALQALNFNKSGAMNKVVSTVFHKCWLQRLVKFQLNSPYICMIFYIPHPTVITSTGFSIKTLNLETPVCQSKLFTAFLHIFLFSHVRPTWIWIQVEVAAEPRGWSCQL